MAGEENSVLFDFGESTEENETQRFRNLYNELRNTDSAFHINSRAFRNVLSALENLCGETEALFAQEERERTHFAVGQELSRIKPVYSELQAACARYLGENAGKRRTELGNTRSILIERIQNLAAEDKKALDDTVAIDTRTSYRNIIMNSRNSSARRSFTDLYSNLKQADSAFHINSREFKNVLSALEKLNARTAPLFQAAEGEQPPVMNAADLTEIRKLYSELKISCTEYLNQKGGTRSSKLGNMRRQLIEGISQLASEDIEALGNVHLDSNTNLPDVIANGRHETVHVDLSSLSSVGGNLSSRIRLNRPEDNLNGFFTAESVVPEINEEVKKVVRRYAEEYPQYRKYIDAMDKEVGEGELKSQFLLSISNTSGLLKPRTREDYERGTEMFRRHFNGIVDSLEDSEIREEISQLREDKSFREMLYQLRRDVALLDNQRDMMGSVGIKVGSNLEKRNVAMSRVAQIIGCPDILAHSSTMIIQDGEKKISGVYMEKAPGLDYTHYETAPDFFRDNLYDTAEAKEQLADLQALDYICGNLDRHTGNMFYQFEQKEDGRFALSKITGIDNDCSFGTMSPEQAKEYSQQLAVPEKMRVLNKSTCDMIQGLSEDVLKFSLCDLLSEEEIQAAWKRTETLQAYIKGSLEADARIENPIRIIQEKAEWDTISLSDLGEGRIENLFGKVDSVRRQVERFKNMWGQEISARENDAEIESYEREFVVDERRPPIEKRRAPERRNEEAPPRRAMSVNDLQALLKGEESQGRKPRQERRPSEYSKQKKSKQPEKASAASAMAK